MSFLQSMFSLSGKTALVTGASTGIGQSIAVGYARAGAEVILLGHRDNLQETADIIEQADGVSHQVIIDLSQIDSIKEKYDALLSDYQIDILVNNAGIIRRQQAVDYSQHDWNDVINTNLNAVFVLTQEVSKNMLKRKQGKVINIASLLSFQGGVFVPAYTASKHAVSGLTKAFANEWASAGVQVNAIAPGYIATNNTQAIREDTERNESILSRIPTGRWGQPDDLVGAAIFLASASDYVNGHTLVVDGGWLAR
ncbi:2-dehydro-3-deoxy-D-gluconate 5-dehydrogenase KduD [Pseudalkalibacillus decolorationis]|uniref:2-dehydro-3-deoxy-D-gluconate 5-dehydrogenase KduD n=1 Tax=Pseudalkalibacillus decolorationis TaxID=163879 RepID=UPI0021485336|nr:2-dehydro-3-deoxy-D-gluconate 5-dehydrogenase KduD [Pseudalkalibacillus decolorationis]